MKIILCFLVALVPLFVNAENRVLESEKVIFNFKNTDFDVLNLDKTLLTEAQKQINEIINRHFEKNEGYRQFIGPKYKQAIITVDGENGELVYWLNLEKKVAQPLESLGEFFGLVWVNKGAYLFGANITCIANGKIQHIIELQNYLPGSTYSTKFSVDEKNDVVAVIGVEFKTHKRKGLVFKKQELILEVDDVAEVTAHDRKLVFTSVDYDMCYLYEFQSQSQKYLKLKSIPLDLSAEFWSIDLDNKNIWVFEYRMDPRGILVTKINVPENFRRNYFFESNCITFGSRSRPYLDPSGTKIITSSCILEISGLEND